PLESRLSRLARALPDACWRSRAFECRAYRQSGTAEIHRRGPKMRPTFFGRARSSAKGAEIIDKLNKEITAIFPGAAPARPSTDQRTADKRQGYATCMKLAADELPERPARNFRPVAIRRVLLGDLTDLRHQSGAQHDRLEAELEQASVLHRKVVCVGFFAR